MLKLTPREIEILEMVKLGHKDKEIATVLSIALQTVKNHMYLICAKLQAVNRVDAIVKAIRAGYIEI
jgi:two-component system NarL family response regulator